MLVAATLNDSPYEKLSGAGVFSFFVETCRNFVTEGSVVQTDSFQQLLLSHGSMDHTEI